MPSPLGSFLGAYQQTKDANAAKAAAAAKDQRDYQFKLGQESRLLTGQANEEIAKLEKFLDQEDWDTSLVGPALSMAQRIDTTYGPVMGGYSALEQTKKRLNLTGTASRSGVQGPPTADGRQAGDGDQSALAGWPSAAQKRSADKAATSEAQAENARGLQASGLNYLAKNTMMSDGTGLDPDRFAVDLLAWESQMMMDSKYTIEDVRKASEQIREQLKPVIESKIAAHPNAKEIREQIEKTSKDASFWIRSQLGVASQGAPGEIVFSLTESAQPLANQLENAAQSMAQAGWALPVIKLQLQQMFMEDGQWKKGIPEAGPIKPYEASISKMSAKYPNVSSDLQKAYDTVVLPSGHMMNPALFEPVYIESTGEVYIMNPETKEGIMLYGPSAKTEAVAPDVKSPSGANVASPVDKLNPDLRSLIEQDMQRKKKKEDGEFKTRTENFQFRGGN